MASHSSILTWRIPCTEEPGGPQSTGSQKVGQATNKTTEQLPPPHLMANTALCSLTIYHVRCLLYLFRYQREIQLKEILKSSLSTQSVDSTSTIFREIFLLFIHFPYFILLLCFIWITPVVPNCSVEISAPIWALPIHPLLPSK